MSHTHTYLKKKGRAGNEYTIISAPTHLLGDDLPQGYRRITREDALKQARWTNDHGPAYVNVTPCACGECALTQYAQAHEHSALAERIRRARTDLMNGQRDILGRLKENPYTGEYTGELPERGAAILEA